VIDYDNIQSDDERKGEASEKTALRKYVVHLLESDNLGLLQNLHGEILFHIRGLVPHKLYTPKGTRPYISD